MGKIIRWPLYITAAMQLVTMTANGAVIVANSGVQNNAAGQTSTTNFIAAGFVSPTATTTMTSVDARFEAGQGLPSITLSLFNNVTGSPGALLGVLGTTTVSVGGTYSFAPVSSIGLAAATQYWLVASCSNCFPASTSPGITNNWGTLDPAVVSGLAGSDRERGPYVLQQ